MPPLVRGRLLPETIRTSVDRVGGGRNQAHRHQRSLTYSHPKLWASAPSRPSPRVSIANGADATHATIQAAPTRRPALELLHITAKRRVRARPARAPRLASFRPRRRVTSRPTRPAGDGFNQGAE